MQACGATEVTLSGPVRIGAPKIQTVRTKRDSHHQTDLMAAVPDPQQRREPTYVGYKFVGLENII